MSKFLICLIFLAVAHGENPENAQHSAWLLASNYFNAINQKNYELLKSILHFPVNGFLSQKCSEFGAGVKNTSITFDDLKSVIENMTETGVEMNEHYVQGATWISDEILQWTLNYEPNNTYFSQFQAKKIDGKLKIFHEGVICQ
ncbi:unnamed protein product [Caenorhabditis angaria]|uniref:Nuclear transport factor 2 family protein n=1 Tax=Caenorhabditis angaria TaxID=860376 RepID=A0A9P1N490_9PELO|nr:unnamed protein product [Caenorhabditis angaria]